MTQVKRIAVTGAAGQIGYSILPRLATGEVFGPDVQVVLQCLEVKEVLKALHGVRMELEDCAPPLLRDIVCTDDPKVAFKDADLILLVGSKPRGPGMQRKDLIRDNGPIFVGQGTQRQQNPSTGTYSGLRPITRRLRFRSHSCSVNRGDLARLAKWPLITGR